MIQVGIQSLAHVGSVASAPVSYLINEGFEGTGAPSGWSGAGNYNFDYSPGLSGSQSLILDSVVSSTAHTGSAFDNAEVWFKFVFYCGTLPSDYNYILQLDNAVSTVPYVLFILPSGVLRIYDTSSFDDTTDGLAAATTYNIWGHYLKGSGSNSVLEVSFGTVGSSRPNSGNKYANMTNGIGTVNVKRLYFYMEIGHGNTAHGFDDLQIAATDAFA